MRFVTHKLGLLILAGMVASVLSISTMLPPRGIDLIHLPAQNGPVVMQEVMIADAD